MDSTIPADLLKLKTRLEAWRAAIKNAWRAIVGQIWRCAEKRKAARREPLYYFGFPAI